MWLELYHTYSMLRHEPEDYVIRWRAELHANVDLDQPEDGQPGSLIVGRILADELRRDEIAECRESVWDVVDADSDSIIALNGENH